MRVHEMTHTLQGQFRAHHTRGQQMETLAWIPKYSEYNNRYDVLITSLHIIVWLE